MFIACSGYVTYSVLPCIILQPDIADIGDKGHPVLRQLLVRYNEGLLYYPPTYVSISLVIAPYLM
jgi:hypothetical protein